jgi:beta-N-acetylhexosaminidase
MTTFTKTMLMPDFPIRIVFILLFSLSMLSASFGQQSNSLDQEVSLDEMIGQMIMVGFRGLEVHSDSAVAQEIAEGKVGGVILFSRDVVLKSGVRNIESPEQVKKLVAQLKSFSRTPLFVSVDQEGGLVSRLSPSYGFPATVAQQYLGSINDTDTTAWYAARMAETLSEMGFNMNFAPVVDVNTNPLSPAIGAIRRSFSADTAIVTAQARIVIEQHRRKNIFCSLKHFPGHGSAGADSHLGFVDVTQTWHALELAPYRALISSGDADLIMTAHIYNEQWDTAYPATLSGKVLTDLLRNELKFEGVIISDDMNMNAIAAFYSPEEAYRLAIEAGVDILLVANNLSYDLHAGSKAHAIIKKLVLDGIISEERIQASYERIMKLKREL